MEQSSPGEFLSGADQDSSGKSAVASDDVNISIVCKMCYDLYLYVNDCLFQKIFCD